MIDFLLSKGLTRIEIGIAEWLATGISTKEIAERVFRAEKTIKWNLTKIYKKLGVKSRLQFIVLYVNLKQDSEKREREEGWRVIDHVD